MTTVTTPETLLGRIRRWYRARFGVAEAEANLARTKAWSNEAKDSLAKTERRLQNAVRHLGNQEWMALYRDRMQDHVE